MMKENQIQIPEDWVECELAELIIEKPKSTIKVSEAANFGEYPFFTSGENILLHDKNIIVGENLFLATGGVANIKYFNGAAAYSTDTFVVSTYEKAKTDYLYYYLLSKVDFINKNYFEGSGLKHLQKKDFRKHIFILPKSTTEQQKIASILSKLDEAIIQTEQLIEKYKQIKVGLMHDLLTRGIDENGNIRSEETHKFKDSPLGRIPVEWDFCPLAFVYELRTGTTPLRANKNYFSDQGYNWVKTLDLNEDYLDVTEEKVTDDALLRTSIKIMPQGTVLVAMYGGWEQIGRTSILSVEGGTNQAIVSLFNPKIQILPEFTLFFLQENRWRWKQYAVSTRKDPNITKNDVEKFVMSYPKNEEEQQTIIDIILKTINQIFLNKEHLSKLKFQKSGLMHDLLTGKVRVGNFEEQEEFVPNTKTIPSKTQAHNQHIEDAVLIAAIVNTFYSDKYPLGRKKVQKLLYLVRRHQEANTACFKKKAAGPYADEVRYKGGEPIAKANKYIVTKTSKAGTVFSKGINIEKALAYIEKWEMLSDIAWLTTQFKYTKVDQLELIATIDMARCDLDKENIPVSLSTVKHLIATNEVWKKKLEKSYFDDFSIQRGIDESYKLFGE